VTRHDSEVVVAYFNVSPRIQQERLGKTTKIIQR